MIPTIPETEESPGQSLPNVIQVIEGYYLETDAYNWIVHEGKRKRSDGKAGHYIKPTYHGNPEQAFRNIQDRVVKNKKAWKTVEELSLAFVATAREMRPAFQQVFV